MKVKLFKYHRAGVRECWMVDPEKRKIVQYDLEHGEIPVIYGPGDSIPVLIWDGACRIDLGELFDTVGFLMDS